MKFRRWTLISRASLISKKTVVSTDEVLLKSSFGNFLKCDGDAVSADTALIEDKSTYSLHLANELPRPEWCILRPFQSGLMLSSQCLRLFADCSLFFAQANYNGDKMRKPISFESMASAEEHVLGEVLYALMSQEG